MVLTDFGIAAIDDATALTATGQLVGSPAYLAPERLDGRPATAATDLWALGVTLYTAVTGRSPFQRDGTLATMAAILTRRPGASPPNRPGHYSSPRRPPDRLRPAPAIRPHSRPGGGATGQAGNDSPRTTYRRPFPRRPRRSRPPPHTTPPRQTPPRPQPGRSGPRPGRTRTRGPPLPTMDGVPHWGVVPAGFPVHLVELMVGDRTGYTVRTYVAADDVVEAVFTAVAGRLPLFRRPEQATEFAAVSAGHDMSEVLHWDWLSESMSRAFLPLLDDHRYDLDLPSANLEMDPARWLPDLIVKAGDVARELVAALAIEEGYALLSPGSARTVLDDQLRASGRRPRPRTVRQWQQRDHGVLASGWQHVVELIGSRVDWQS